MYYVLGTVYTEPMTSHALGGQPAVWPCEIDTMTWHRLFDGC